MTKEQILAQELFTNFDSSDQAAIDAAWLEEVRSREAAFTHGEMGSAPLEDVLIRIQSKALR